MDKKESKLKNIFAKIKSVKHIEIIIAVIAVVIMLIIYFTTLNPTKAKNNNDTQINDAVETDYCTQMKHEITAAVANMCGSSPTVVISWESSVESVIAYITNSSSSGTSSAPQIITVQGTSSPIILKEIYPKALGVVVICQGGDNVKTKLDIISAVSVLLDITPDKIHVFPSKK